MSKVKFLVMRTGYVESNSTEVLILSREDGSSFEPEEGAAHLVELVKYSCQTEYGRRRWLNPDAELEDCVEEIRDAYWGTCDSTGWHWQEMSDNGWTNYKFPDSSSDCYFVEEKAPLWMLECWEKKNPDWRESENKLLEEELKERALSKLSPKERKALGIE